ncbi:MAG: lysophospholipid acyltransferase family protein [Armatimonadota bacterium]|nr:lysophospholipid acyltransferase family protein [Armatimonadota bacterium]MDR7520763.1 lysophospholipid acyltransferase family protein [Armatimonadota bacterium]MDR7549240.1 lysophospholipid acyltransferase family protein [Armatimonadota bacterium]
MTARFGIWYLILQILYTAWTRLQFRLRVEGREHVPPEGGVLAVCNHNSAVDPWIAGVAFGRPARYMAKEELMRVPVIGWLVSAMGAFPVRRGEADRRSLRIALDALARGQIVLMFPEGTRSPDGRLRTGERGAALLALRSGAPVLPTAIIGSHRVMPRGAWFPRSHPVTVRFGPVIPVPRREGKIDRAELDEWTRRFMAAIAALLPPEQQPVEVDGPAVRAPRAEESV